jgi:RNA polymerase sigma factor (sigma-70 family)
MKNLTTPPKSDNDAGPGLVGEQTFEQVYEGYRSFVYHIAYDFWNDRETAEDITQEVFIKVLPKSLPAIKNMRAYLRMITRHECIDMLRKYNTRRRQKAENGMTETFVEPPVEISDILRIVTSILNKGEEVYFKVFEDIVLKDKKHEEVAKERGISINTVRTHYKRAQKILREKIGKNIF